MPIVIVSGREKGRINYHPVKSYYRSCSSYDCLLKDGKNATAAALDRNRKDSDSLNEETRFDIDLKVFRVNNETGMKSYLDRLCQRAYRKHVKLFDLTFFSLSQNNDKQCFHSFVHIYLICPHDLYGY